MNNTEEIIGLVEEVMSNKKCNTPTKSSAGCKYRHQFDGCVCCDCILGRLDQILCLLPPPCSECGGSKRVVSRSENIYPRSGTKPCPVCQAPAGKVEEFAKEARAIVRMGEKSYEAMRACEGHPSGCEQLLWDACSKLKRACAHLETQAKQIKELGDGIETVNAACVKKTRRLQAKIEQLEGALVKIDSWAKAYPLKVFPEPDFKKAAEVLKAAGLTLDAISASNMRHVISGVKDIVDQALQKEKP